MRTDQKLFCLKTVLTIFLSLCWLVDAAVFGVLLWLRLDYWTNEYLEVESDLDRYLILVYIALAAGAVGVAFSIFGLIGGCLKKNWMLIIYLLSVFAAIFLTIGAFVYGIIYRVELKESLLNDEFLGKVVLNKYTQIKNDRITKVMDIMQSELECCGGNSPHDYIDSHWRAVINPPAGLTVAPPSCCKGYQKYGNTMEYCKVYEDDSVDVYTDKIWQKGCNDALQEFFDRYVIVIICIAAVFFVLQLICLIITFCYVCLLRNMYVPQPDDIVYDMAHSQEKSPYPSRGDYRDYYH